MGVALWTSLILTGLAPLALVRHLEVTAFTGRLSARRLIELIAVAGAAVAFLSIMRDG